MRVYALFPALDVYTSDSTRQLQIWLGMRGLRHKSRHKSRTRLPATVVNARANSLSVGSNP